MGLFAVFWHYFSYPLDVGMGLDYPIFVVCSKKRKELKMEKLKRKREAKEGKIDTCYYCLFVYIMFQIAAEVVDE